MKSGSRLGSAEFCYSSQLFLRFFGPVPVGPVLVGPVLVGLIPVGPVPVGPAHSMKLCIRRAMFTKPHKKALKVANPFAGGSLCTENRARVVELLSFSDCS